MVCFLMVLLHELNCYVPPSKERGILFLLQIPEALSLFMTLLPILDDTYCLMFWFQHSFQ